MLRFYLFKGKLVGKLCNIIIRAGNTVDARYFKLARHHMIHPARSSSIFMWLMCGRLSVHKENPEVKEKCFICDRASIAFLSPFPSGRRYSAVFLYFLTL